MSLQTRKITNVYGQTITIFAEDYVGRKILEKGIYEGPILDYIGRLLKQMNDPVVFDVGANIGNHTLAFSLNAARVYAFEPVPQIFAVLSENIAQNHIHHIKLFNLALSDHSGEEKIFVFSDNMGASSFDQHEENLETVSVQLREGDALVANEEITRCDFMKVDTEGHEAYVLKGLAKTIHNNRPFVMVEWHDTQTKQRFAEEKIFDQVFFDYCIFALGSNYDLAYWQEWPTGRLWQRLNKLFCKKRSVLYSFDPQKNYKNILLVPKEKMALVEKIT